MMHTFYTCTHTLHKFIHIMHAHDILNTYTHTHLHNISCPSNEERKEQQRGERSGEMYGNPN